MIDAMSGFEYVLVLVSIVMGLGITQNLRSISILDFSEERKNSVLHVCLLGSLILLQVDYWFKIWGQSTKESWDVLEVLILFSIPMFLYLAGAYLERASTASESYLSSRMNCYRALLGWFVSINVSFFYFVDFTFWPMFHAHLAVVLVLFCLGSFVANEKAQILVAGAVPIWTISLLFALGRQTVG